MMIVKRTWNSFLSPRSAVGVRAGLVCALALSTSAAWSQAQPPAQSGDLPSNPTPNPSSLSNPYYGSVTLHPATDGVLKLSLDESVRRGFESNLGLKEAEENEKTFRGQEIAAFQYFLPNIYVSGGTGVDAFNLAAFGFGP